MSALYAILGALFVLAGVATGYRVWEKRSRQKQDSVITPPVVERQLEDGQPTTAKSVAPASVASEVSSGEEKTASASVSLSPEPTVSVSPASRRVTAPQVDIPDPWLSEPEPEIEETATQTAAPCTEKPVDSPTSSPTSTSVPDQTVPPIDTAALSEKIAALGRSRKLEYAASLTKYLKHSDSRVRASVAKALGDLAANRSGTSIEAFIPVLGKLSQDSNPEVRLAAVNALGNIPSFRVLPWLQQAQRQPNPSISKAATASLQRLKLTYQPKSGKQKAQPRKETGKK